MTDEIEREALALLNEAYIKRGSTPLSLSEAYTKRGSTPLSLSEGKAFYSTTWPIIYRAVELLHAERAAHEATKAELATFRQEVSEAVGGLCAYFSKLTNLNPNNHPAWPRGVPPFSTGEVKHYATTLSRFILPPPDPITEWLHKSGYEGNAAVEQAVRAYAEENGDG